MIRAIHFDDRTEFRARRLPGSVHFTDPGTDRVSYMWFFCPCGCGELDHILTGVEFKPQSGGPSWLWNGSRTEPTLRPSVHRQPHWHGWLRDGYWEAC